MAGFFDSLLGGTTKTAVTTAAGANATGISNATNASNAGRDAALGYNRQGLELAFPALQGGYDTARSDINYGIGRAHEALNAGGTAAKDYLTSGYGSARDEMRNAMMRIQGYYDPYLQAGSQAQSLYGTFLGLNGEEAAKSAAASFAGMDPGIAYRQDMLAKRNAASANQAGFIGSGRAALADSRAQSELLSTDYQRYLDRLAGQSELGSRSAGQLSGFEMSGAGTIGGYYGREADQLAANEQRHAAALQGLYTQNPIGTGQLATNQGRDISSLYSGYANNNQNISTGNTTQQTQLALAGGQNLANMYMGQAAADAAGAKNAIGLGGMAMSAMIPGSGGVSALGNLAGGLNGMLNYGKPSDYGAGDLGGTYWG